MCQHMNRIGGVAAWARASFGVSSDSSDGNAMLAARPRRIVRRGMTSREGRRASAASAFGSKVTFLSRMSRMLMALVPSWWLLRLSAPHPEGVVRRDVHQNVADTEL